MSSRADRRRRRLPNRRPPRGPLGRRHPTLTVAPVGVRAATNGRTSFRVVNIDDPSRWTAGGTVASQVQLRAGDAELSVEMPVAGESVLLRPQAGL